METRSTRYLSFPTSIHVLQYTIHLLLTMHGNNIIHKFNKVMNTQQQLARTTTPVIVTRVIMAGPALQTIMDTLITIVVVQMDLLGRIVSFF